MEKLFLVKVRLRRRFQMADFWTLIKGLAERWGASSCETVCRLLFRQFAFLRNEPIFILLSEASSLSDLTEK